MSTSSAGLFKGSQLSALDRGIVICQSSYHHSLVPPSSGLVAYRELIEAGLDVRIFERDSVPGGNWHYTDEVPLDAPVPNAPAAISDFVPSLPPTGVDLPCSDELEDDGKTWRDHTAPRPLWESLSSNAPSVSCFVWRAILISAYAYVCVAFATGRRNILVHYSSRV